VVTLVGYLYKAYVSRVPNQSVDTVNQTSQIFTDNNNFFKQKKKTNNGKKNHSHFFKENNDFTINSKKFHFLKKKTICSFLKKTTIFTINSKKLHFYQLNIRRNQTL